MQTISQAFQEMWSKDLSGAGDILFADVNIFLILVIHINSESVF